MLHFSYRDLMAKRSFANLHRETYVKENSFVFFSRYLISEHPRKWQVQSDCKVLPSVTKTSNLKFPLRCFGLNGFHKCSLHNQAASLWYGFSWGTLTQHAELCGNIPAANLQHCWWLARWMFANWPLFHENKRHDGPLGRHGSAGVSV